MDSYENPYQQALEAAGAVVLAFNTFGDYQGTWYAKVLYNGEEGWVEGYYGSCSGCDAFESEFGLNEKKCHEHRYKYDHEPCEKCDEKLAKYQEKFISFGKSYLNLLTQEQIEKLASNGSSWDSERLAGLEWVRQNAIGT